MTLIKTDYWTWKNIIKLNKWQPLIKNCVALCVWHFELRFDCIYVVIVDCILSFEKFAHTLKSKCVKEVRGTEKKIEWESCNEAKKSQMAIVVL